MAEAIGLQSGFGESSAGRRGSSRPRERDSFNGSDPQPNADGPGAPHAASQTTSWMSSCEVAVPIGEDRPRRWVWQVRRTQLPSAQDQIVRRGRLRTVLLVGDGPLADRITEYIREAPSKYRLIGHLVPYPSGCPGLDAAGVDLDPLGNLEDIIQRDAVQEVVVAFAEQRGAVPLDQLLACRLRGVRVVEGVSFYEELAEKVPLTYVRPGHLIFADPCRHAPLLKRSLDLVIALMTLILTSPLFLLLALLIKGTSPGPVFYRQERVGLRGRRFTIFKFRSMYANAETAGRAVWAQEHDSRITTVGRYMRKFRLDELPQMLNVLRGEMSVVGPRPERPEFLALLAREVPFYTLRLAVKPGITGWAQVKFRYGATVQDAAEKLQYDLYYIRHMSLAFDSLIALKTIRTVLFQSGAR